MKYQDLRCNSRGTLFKGFILSGGEEHDAPAGRLLLETLVKQETVVPLLMDRAYADIKTRFTAGSYVFMLLFLLKQTP